MTERVTPLPRAGEIFLRLVFIYSPILLLAGDKNELYFNSIRQKLILFISRKNFSKTKCNVAKLKQRKYDCLKRYRSVENYLFELI